MARLRTGDGHAGLAECDVVIEAAPEKQELKLEIFKSLGEVCEDERDPGVEHVVDLDHEARGAQIGRPDRVIGMHFMNPVPVMKLVEIVRGLPTGDATNADGDRARAALRQDDDRRAQTSPASSSIAC